MMTDKELIQALRCCEMFDGCCECPASEDDCRGASYDHAADRLEALLASNGRLKKQLDELELELIAQEALLAENAELKKNVALLLKEKSEMGEEIRKKICKNSNLELEIGRLEAVNDHLREVAKMVGEDTNVPTKWVSVTERYESEETP